MTWKAVLVSNNSLIRCLDVLRFVRRFANQNGEENDSHRPNVYLERVTPGCLVALNDFWGNVIGCSTDGLSFFIGMLQFRGQSKVAYFNTEMTIQKQVAQLEITMDNTIVVKMQDSIEKLSHKQGSFWLCETLSALDHFIQTLVVAKFKQNVAIVAIFEEVLVFTNILVFQCAVDLNLGL